MAVDVGMSVPEGRSGPAGRLDSDEVRVITYNTAGGNRRFRALQAGLVTLPFYAEALSGTPDAPLLALQEVGEQQARAVRRAAQSGRARVLYVRRPGLGNALVIPDRFEVLSHHRRFYVGSQLRGLARGLWRWHRERQRQNWRQYAELRMSIEALLRDRRSGRRFTIINTHLSIEPGLRDAQAESLLRRARAAARRGPVIVAADLNVRVSAHDSPEAPFAQLLREFPDMGAPGSVAPDLDFVLAAGFLGGRSRTWSGESLFLPGRPNAESVSDHLAEDHVLRFSSDAPGGGKPVTG